MDPRNKSSKKWTEFPTDYLVQTRDLIEKTFKKPLGSSQVIIEGRIYPAEIILRLGILPPERLKQNNFEVSLDYKKGKDNVLKLMNLALDCAASMMEQYLSGEDEDEFPRQWKEFEIESRKVFVQYSTVNTALESQADELLGEVSGNLVEGDTDSAEIDLIKDKLGIRDDEE